MNRQERRAAKKRRDGSATQTDALVGSFASVSVRDLAAEANHLHNAGRMADAQDICRHILAREPSHPQTVNLLGLIAQTLDDHRTALKFFKKAIASDDLNNALHYNAGNSYQALGNQAKAISHYNKALDLGMEDKAVSFVLQSPVIATHLARIAGKWPLSVTGSELFGTEGISRLAKDLLLRCTLQTTTLASMQLEVLLGYARTELLRLANEKFAADDDILAFACALARQCFLNEYVYGPNTAESERARLLRDQLLRDLESGAYIDAFTLAAVAAHFPFHAMRQAELLLARDWPAAITSLLRVQLREPLQEQNDRSAIPALTPVEHGVSVDVMHQYEENPYPRWTINPLHAFAIDRERGRVVPTPDEIARKDILIAGCGTGMHAIQIAQVYPNARLLAIDISRSSLAYAGRKTRELGSHNIEYAQADILELGTIDRTFDSIESVGVLHHLAEPMVGWRVLVSLLRPGGTMRIGLYSEAARQVIVRARSHIAARGYRATADDIRRCRQDIFREAKQWTMLIEARDFYSMSGCRDLLFNVMEHRFTIPQIAKFLEDNDLSFQGFEPFDDPGVLARFHRMFADAADEMNLDQWHRFEAAHPETFWGMYIFMAGKKAEVGSPAAAR